MQRQAQIQFEEIIKSDEPSRWKITGLIQEGNKPDADTIKLAKAVLDDTTEFKKKKKLMAIYNMLLIAQDPKEGFKQFVKNFSGFRENFTLGQAHDELTLLRETCYDGIGIRLIVPDAKPDTYILTSDTEKVPLRVSFTEQGLQAFAENVEPLYEFCFDGNSNEQAFELYLDKHLQKDFYPDLESPKGMTAAKETILQNGGYLLTYLPYRDVEYRCYTLVEDKVVHHEFDVVNGGFYSKKGEALHSDLASLLKSFNINPLQEQKSEAPSKENQLRQYKQQIEQIIQKQYEEKMLGEAKAVSYAQAKFKLLRNSAYESDYIIRKAENMPDRFKVTLLVPPLFVDHLLSDKNKSMREVKSEIDALRVSLQEKVKQKTKPSQEQKQEVKSEFTTDVAKDEFQNFVKTSFQEFLAKEQGNLFTKDKEKMFREFSIEKFESARVELNNISKSFGEFIKPKVEPFLDKLKEKFGEDQVVLKKIKINTFVGDREQYYEDYAYDRLAYLVNHDFKSMLLPAIKEAADKYYKEHTLSDYKAPTLSGRVSSFFSALISRAPKSAQPPKGPEGPKGKS